MNKLLCGILALTVSLVMVESLTCNVCKVGLLSKCLVSGTKNCSAAQPNCFTGRAVFEGIPQFVGFKTQGCLDTPSCNRTVPGTILGASYNTTYRCCSTDRCDAESGANTVQLSLTAGAALLVSMWSIARC
ncbi:hypothetical protein AGOR_G00210470 [Albula goreensis]|uniref:UPAR/Ly6 domain-containing protein n=1 Tax=Albula goreensis TaxID=1534307 RepID=A0A8T3CLY1_9TELE|nr:hypothetical protein AGOR_G00210470 [Albula goreensis]